jgi:aspartyl protease family protein
MRNILVIAAVMIGAGTLMGQMASRSTSFSSSSPTTVAVASTQSQPKVQRTVPPGGRKFTVEKDRRGHFQVRAYVDGRDLRFMVDTGASVVALTERDAAQIGVRPMPADYTVNVSTANGNVKAARTRLRRVEIGGLYVDDVDALVLPDKALSENLLGLSYLSRLKRYEFAGSTLVLEQ